MIYKEYQNIPENWSLVRLDQIAEINPKKRKKVLQNGEWIDVTPDTLVTFLAMEDVSESAKILNRQNKTYAEVETGYTSFKEQDILVAKITPCFENGKGAWAKDLNNGIGFGTTEFHVIRAKKEINKKWLNYITSSYFFRKRGELNMQGSAGQKRIPTNFVKSYRLPKPSKKEQDEIAKIISSWDEAISQTEKLIKVKKRYKKGLMQRLLSGKVRFPEFVKSEEVRKTRFGIYPKDWEYKKIQEIAIQVKDKVGDETVGYTVMSCTKHDGLVSSLEYFDRQVFSKDISNYKAVEKGEFAYATNHVEEGSIGYNNWCEKGAISPMYTVFKAHQDKIDNDYLYAILKTENYRRIFEIFTNGTVNRRGSLRWKDFKKIKIPVPALEEQKAISALLIKAEQEIQLIEEQLEKYQKQKKGLMQLLLTGKVRVN